MESSAMETEKEKAMRQEKSQELVHLGEERSDQLYQTPRRGWVR